MKGTSLLCMLVTLYPTTIVLDNLNIWNHMLSTMLQCMCIMVAKWMRIDNFTLDVTSHTSFLVNVKVN